MPHQCVRCGKLHATGSNPLLEGCDCGSRFFFFVKKEALDHVQASTRHLSSKDREQIELDIMEIIGDPGDEKPIILDFESIKVNNPGQYEIDLVDLFKGKPLIYKLEEGKYVIDIVSTFESKSLD